MKIAILPMFYPPTYGSGPVLMEEFSKYLMRCGHDVTVITTQPEKGRFRKGFFNTRKDNNLKIIRNINQIKFKKPVTFIIGDRCR